MNRGMKIIRKLVVAIIGIPVVVIGVILIPLPGPGLLVCLLGFFILSLEFEFAEKQLQRGKIKIRQIYDESKKRSERFK